MIDHKYVDRLIIPKQHFTVVFSKRSFRKFERKSLIAFNNHPIPYHALKLKAEGSDLYVE